MVRGGGGSIKKPYDAKGSKDSDDDLTSVGGEGGGSDVKVTGNAGVEPSKEREGAMRSGGC